jgi:hypothetical protein
MFLISINDDVVRSRSFIGFFLKKKKKMRTTTTTTTTKKKSTKRQEQRKIQLRLSVSRYAKDRQTNTQQKRVRKTLAENMKRHLHTLQGYER